MKRNQDDFVSASELARMGYCERQVAFDAACGERVGPSRRKARLRGLHLHEEFYQESQRIARASETKGRCFVATLAFGESDETRALRAFRDLYLRRSFAGRWFIRAYYRASPGLCVWMQPRPGSLAAARAVISPLSKAAAAAVARKLRPR